MVCTNRGIYGFLGPSWVLITYNICPPVLVRDFRWDSQYVRTACMKTFKYIYIYLSLIHI